MEEEPDSLVLYYWLGMIEVDIVIAFAVEKYSCKTQVVEDALVVGHILWVPPR